MACECYPQLRRAMSAAIAQRDEARQRLIDAHQRIEDAVRKVSAANLERRGYHGFDSVDEDLTWLVGVVRAALRTRSV